MSNSDPRLEGDDTEEPDLTMTLDMNILQHLGLKMYTSLPAVISEYVANAWDAGATEVAISVPTKESVSNSYAITIVDNGVGMSYDEVENKFLVVGRDRRRDEDSDTVKIRGMERPIMGRKGIGKLAGFGVAGKVIVKTQKSGRYIEFVLDYDQMKNEGNEDNPAETSTYTPDVVDWGTCDEDLVGTEVTLTDLNRKRQPTLRYIKERIARRFAVIDENFAVQVNGEPVEPTDRGLKRSCSYINKYDSSISDSQGNEYRVHGWIGTTDRISDDEQKGVAIMCRGKLVQEPTFLGVTSTGFGGFGLDYTVGEIHADFVDNDNLDLVSTDRSSLAWGKEPATQLREWLRERIAETADEGAEQRRRKRLSEARQTSSYDERITGLPENEQREIDTFIQESAEHREFKSGQTDEFIERVADSAEQKVFTDFLTDMKEVDVSDTDVVFDLFDRWEVLDALELMQVAQGRLETISKFRELIESNTGNDEQVYRFMSENPWVLEPRWDYVDDEPEYREEIDNHFPPEIVHNDSSDRVKIFCLGYGENLNIVEILRPNDTIERRHLENLERYVDHLDGYVSRQDDLYRSVAAYVIGGEISSSAEQKADRLEGHDIYGRTYERMQQIAENTFDQFLTVFRNKAEKTNDERLMKRVESLEREAPSD